MQPDPEEEPTMVGLQSRVMLLIGRHSRVNKGLLLKANSDGAQPSALLLSRILQCLFVKGSPKIHVWEEDNLRAINFLSKATARSGFLLPDNIDGALKSTLAWAKALQSQQTPSHQAHFLGYQPHHPLQPHLLSRLLWRLPYSRPQVQAQVAEDGNKTEVVEDDEDERPTKVLEETNSAGPWRLNWRGFWGKMASLPGRRRVSPSRELQEVQNN